MRIIAGGSSYPVATQPRPLPSPAATSSQAADVGAETPASSTTTLLPAAITRTSLLQQSLPAGLPPRHRQALQAYLGVQRLPDHGVDVLGLDAQA